MRLAASKLAGDAQSHLVSGADYVDKLFGWQGNVTPCARVTQVRDKQGCTTMNTEHSDKTTLYFTGIDAKIA
jgi:hypothetical protein